MKIELLADNRAVIPVLSRLYQTEWEPYYGIYGPGDAQADLESRCNRDVLPLGVVAMEDREAIGTAALDFDQATSLTPSVVGLLVRHCWRRKGVATAMLAAAEEISIELGYDRIYLSSTILSDLLLRMGWQLIGHTEFLNGERGSIYMRKMIRSNR